MTERGCIPRSGVPDGLTGCENANDVVDSTFRDYGIAGFVTKESLFCYCDAYNLCNDGTESENRKKEHSEGGRGRFMTN